MEDPPPLTYRRIVARGFTRRCPLCGSRGIFTSWFRQADRCPRCNYPTTRVDDQWIGSLGINTIVSFTLLFAAIAVGFAVTYPDPSVGPILVVAVLVAAVFPVVFFPISKSLWSAIDMAMRPPEPDDDVDPRYLPATPHRER
ncbi:MAG: DUF983 domain-containing protein [Acidimicrobiia bacterium]